MQLFLMEAMTLEKPIFINTVNADFRKWARDNGATAGIGMSLPTRTTGTGMLPRQQVAPSNLHLYEQKFECACGYCTHIAGKFYDHVHQCNTISKVAGV